VIMPGPLSRIVVRVGADVSGFRAGLARTTRLADDWAGSIGPKIDKAFAGLGSSSGHLQSVRRVLDGMGAATSLGRATLGVGDLHRAGVGARNTFDRLKLAFMGGGEAADRLRAKIDRTAASIKAGREASEKWRFKLFLAELAQLGAKAAVVAEQKLPGLVFSAARSVEGVVGLGSSVVRTSTAFRDFAPNAAKVVQHLWRARDAARGTADRATNLAEAWYHAKRAGIPLLTMGDGLRGLAAGALNVARGVVGVGVAFLKVGWNVVATAVSGLVSVFTSLASTLVSVGSGLALVGGLAAAGVATFLVKAASHAAHLNETFNKTRDQFGQYAGGVLKASAAMSRAYGTQQREFLDGASSLGALLQGVGYAERDAAKLAANFSKLAADLSARRDLPFATSLQKIMSGLSGEAEPLKSLGILIDEDTVKLYAYQKGIAKVGKELSQTQKVQARMALIVQGLTKDMGALSRESDGPAARIAEFWGRLDALTVAIGTSVAPAFGELLGGINVGLHALKTAWEANSEAVFGWFGVTSEAAGKAGWGVQAVTAGVVVLAKAWAFVGGAVEAAMAKVYRFAAGSLDALSGLYNVIGEGMNKVGLSGDKLIGPILVNAAKAKGFRREAKEWERSASEWVGTGERLADLIREAMVKGLEDVGKAAKEAMGALDFAANPKNVGAPYKAERKQGGFSGAYTLGSKEAASVEANHAFGLLRNEQAAAAKRTAVNTAELVQVGRETLQAIRSNLGPGVPFINVMTM